MTVLASLPMYAAGSAANAALWQCVADQLNSAAVPATLAQPTDLLAHWLDPALLLSQTCGYPLTHALAGRVQLVGAFRYTAPGCDGLRYRSQLVCRSTDAGLPLAGFRGRTVAYNSEDSQSGHNSLRALVAPLARNGVFFGKAVATGSHHASLESVCSGQADLAAIDCVTLALLQRDHPEKLRGVQVCGHTAPAPGLPLITSLQTPPDVLLALRQALHHAMRAEALAGARAALLIEDFSELPLDDYDAITLMEARATRAGYRL
ncbi:PhnD/SsuA/transferrin family substrate-binding protein [Rhodoferax sp.]|uniref:phosphate/phosphite/phosphonate ABC transporter substrate-binding protein n=1 Tax=Rhodoferax sp. TaxID=50421 RepID=UPI0025F9F080|nr:PhnD/SsuA/transferrin family substrate-binding protein [Rhodoferax sp.]